MKLLEILTGFFGIFFSGNCRPFEIFSGVVHLVFSRIFWNFFGNFRKFFVTFSVGISSHFLIFLGCVPEFSFRYVSDLFRTFSEPFKILNCFPRTFEIFSDLYQLYQKSSIFSEIFDFFRQLSGFVGFFQSFLVLSHW